MMRSNFDRQLAELNQKMITLGMLCETAISTSSKALLTCDPAAAEEMPELLGQITEGEREIEGICMKLLLHQQPVAKDLRTVSSALKMVTDAQRIGTQSTDIAEILALNNIHEIPPTLPIAQLTDTVIRMVTDSIDSFVKQDRDIALSVIQHDDVADQYFSDCKDTLISLIRQPPVNSEAVVDLLMIAKYYERIGDHAVNIAKWVLFSITASHDIDDMIYNWQEENTDK